VTNAVADEPSVVRAESRRFVLLCGLAPAILTATLVVFRPDFVAKLDYGAYDVLLRSIPASRPDGRVAIVDIDDLSLSTIGQWPWRRDRIAQLISRLREQGAAVIALDVVFAEADRFDAGPNDSSPLDASLARALVDGRVVLGYALTFAGTDTGRECVLHPLALPIVQSNADTEVPLFHASGAVCSLPSLARSAGRSGFLNAVPDADGILRRVPLVIDYNDTTYPSLALAAVLAAGGGKVVALRSKNENTTSLELGTGTIPLDGLSNLLVRYRGPKRTFP
jgi:adenylate cyclase